MCKLIPFSNNNHLEPSVGEWSLLADSVHAFDLLPSRAAVAGKMEPQRSPSRTVVIDTAEQQVFPIQWIGRDRSIRDRVSTF